MGIVHIVTVFISAAICFSTNIFVGHSLYISYFNSLLLGVSLLFAYLVQKKINEEPLFIIISLSFIPLFYSYQAKYVVYFLLLLSLLFLFVAIKLEKYRYILFIICSLSYLGAALVSNGIVSEDFKLNKDKLIWNVNEANQSIINHQKDARYVPYRIRLVIYNKAVYIYSAVTSIAGLLNLRNLYDVLLLANIYPLLLGIWRIYRNRDNSINKILLLLLTLILFSIGINRSPDKFSSLFVAAPFFVYLIILGFHNTNKFVYFTLFVLSIILVTSPV